ncbi:MAG: hypothetical protein BWY87_01230 [Deltaproteobacteria bacterium ADurb.Bin510]|nr:MAG: hypothetical protein BWY87_01230 [Deltaproteobacteria bacterium ADurb.Bin510]
MLATHLCQPDTAKSCGACCGLYNYPDSSRAALIERLGRRSSLMERVRAGEIDLQAYRQRLAASEDQRRIYATIYSCEFVGFIDADRRRVGCLLHPAANAGCDLREQSFYGRQLCDGHFCPSYQKLAQHEVDCLLRVIDDWYLWGAVITDIDFVKEFFRQVEPRLGEAVRPERLGTMAAAWLKDYCALKLDWPWRDQSRPRFGKYFFVGEDYDIAQIDYAALGCGLSVYDRVLVSLASAFESRAELQRAEERLSQIMEGFIDGYRSGD